MRTVDKEYCMSHYLAFRFVENENKDFFENVFHRAVKPQKITNKELIRTIDDIERVIKEKIQEHFIPNKTAIFLSGGIDSAILASYLPEGTPCYTFKCIADGAIDETIQAKKYADMYNLKHENIEITWEDFEKLTPEILKYDGEPFHSIEVQLVKAIKHIKKQGIELVIVGDGADMTFGGLNRVLSKDWDFDEFVKFYTFVDPKKVLKNPVDVSATFEKFRINGNKFDFIRFIEEHMAVESDTSFLHVYEKENIKHLEPYSYMKLAEPLDLNRIRNGEPKYMLKELFKRRYPNMEIPDKIPMPRPMDQWLKSYGGGYLEEFIPNCAANLKGDQKWLIWCLEQFLNMYKGEH